MNTKHIEVRCHHIGELTTDKNLDVRKEDTKVNITDTLQKPLPDQHVGMLRGKMRLLQAEGGNRVKYEGVEDKSIILIARLAETVKSKEPNNWKIEDVAKLEEVERTEN